MIIIVWGAGGDLAINCREQEIYQTVVRCLGSRSRLMKLHTISGWVATGLIGGLVGLATHNPYLAIMGALVARWLMRQLAWRALRGTHELLGEVILQLRREPSGVTLANKLNRGEMSFINGNRSGAAYSLHLMHDRILDPYCWSNSQVATQFLRTEPEPLGITEGSTWSVLGDYALSDSPFFN